jgi:spermidine synthase
MLNVAVALVLIAKFKREIVSVALLRTWAMVVFGLLLVGFVFSERILSFSESMAYSDPVILSRSSHYQRIILTKRKNDLRLFLNGNLQFSSSDEYRYHEALVHPAMVRAESINKVLVLGGGDGMAVREVLKYPEVDSITLVDLDPEVTKLFRENHLLNALNDSSLLHPKVNVLNEDAFLWMKKSTNYFDVIIIDFPDPSNYSIGKLYSTAFYRTVYPRLQPHGVVVVQSTSPYFAPKSYWCVNETMRDCGFQTIPFHTYVPSFGEWGFLMAMKTEMKTVRKYPQGLRFMNEDVFTQSKYFAPDMLAKEIEINKLNNQVLVHYFEEEWAQYSGH